MTQTIHYRTFTGGLRHKLLEAFVKHIDTYVVDSYSQIHVTIKYLKDDTP